MKNLRTYKNKDKQNNCINDSIFINCGVVSLAYPVPRRQCIDSAGPHPCLTGTLEEGGRMVPGEG